MRDIELDMVYSLVMESFSTMNHPSGERHS